VRISLLAVGRVKDAHAAALCADYDRRIRRLTSFEVLEVKDVRGRDPAATMQTEADRLLPQLPTTCRPVLLDERGTRRTSEGLAAWFEERSYDTKELRFVLGGPWGFDDRLRARARDTLRLSDMTLPHELCRVVCLEQIYRALSINAGSRYHHGAP